MSPMVRFRVACASAAVFTAAAAAQAVVLYDGSAGTAPETQGSLTYLALPPLNYTSTVGGSTTLDTTSTNSIYAGYLTTIAPLNRATGFTVGFDVRVLASSFTHPSRAGFSVIAIADDKRGIEIGFHGDEVFAQDDGANLFVRDESASINTTSAVTHYDLTVLGDAYTLRAAGVPVLTGPIRDYTPFVGTIDPYETPNFLFFGDDSTSASGATQIFRIEVTVPEPAIGLGALALIAMRRRRANRTPS